jgi:citrate lyase subunit beta / citryl-CoA lyase
VSTAATAAAPGQADAGLSDAGQPGTVAAVAGATTVLFVPGDRPERFAKAAAAGAGVVIIDLEDAVAAADKATARTGACRALAPAASPSSSQPPVRALVRVNPQGSAWHEADLQALEDLAGAPGHGLLGLVLPKAEDPEQVLVVRRRLPEDLALVALVESARGIARAVEIAQVPGLTRLAFGAVDFGLDIDAGPEPRALDYARSAIVVASRAAGLPAPLDSPSTAIRDLERVAGEARRGRGLGFGGTLCIHPAQIVPAAAAHAPTGEELDWAERVLAVSGVGAAQVDGEMIDRPVLDRAHRILVRAGRAGHAGKDHS